MAGQGTAYCTVLCRKARGCNAMYLCVYIYIHIHTYGYIYIYTYLFILGALESQHCCCQDTILGRKPVLQEPKVRVLWSKVLAWITSGVLY